MVATQPRNAMDSQLLQGAASQRQRVASASNSRVKPMNGRMGMMLLQTKKATASKLESLFKDCWALRTTMFDAAHMDAPATQKTRPNKVVAGVSIS